MGANLDWRRIEAALVEVLKRQGMGEYIDRPSRTGDALLGKDRPKHLFGLNLTLLAQDLAKELE